MDVSAAPFQAMDSPNASPSAAKAPISSDTSKPGVSHPKKDHKSVFSCFARHSAVDEQRNAHFNTPDLKLCNNFITTSKYDAISFIPRSLFEQ
jgi:hypothetical protein